MNDLFHVLFYYICLAFSRKLQQLEVLQAQRKVEEENTLEEEKMRLHQEIKRRIALETILKAVQVSTVHNRHVHTCICVNAPLWAKGSSTQHNVYVFINLLLFAHSMSAMYPCAPCIVQSDYQHMFILCKCTTLYVRMYIHLFTIPVYVFVWTDSPHYWYLL